MQAIQHLKARAENYVRYYQWRTRYPVHYDAKPQQVYLEPTNFCNLKCIMCPHFDGLKRPKGFMDLALYKNLVDQIVSWGVRHVALFYGGESFLHKGLFDMIRYAKDRGLYTRVHSNGLLLDEAKAGETLQAGLDELSFSIDGLEKVSYEKYRNPGKFERAIAAVRTFLEAKQKAGVRHPKTVIQCILMDETPMEELHRRAQLAFGDLPYDSIRFRLPHSWAGSIPKDRISHAPSNVHLDIEYKYAYAPCPQPWDRLIVGWAGDTYPCCQDLNGGLVVGDVKNQRLAEIWNGKLMQELRQSFVDRTYAKYPICANCEVPFASRPFHHTWQNKGKYLAAKLLRFLPGPGSVYMVKED